MPLDTAKEVIKDSWFWTDRMLWSVVVMFMLGSMARTFVSDEPFDGRKFFGELIFSLIGAVMMYSMGLMQGMNEAQIICFGAGASLGGVRAFEWFMKISQGVRAASSITGKD